MATKNTYEQLRFGADEHPAFMLAGPFEVARPNRAVDPRLARSQSERDIDRELHGHQMSLPSLENLVVVAAREHQDKTFFERMEVVAAEAIDLPQPTETDTVIDLDQAGANSRPKTPSESA